MTDPAPDQTSSAIPVVLFVCVKNGGKSQMAAALLRHLADRQRTGPDPKVEVHSAGTQPGTTINAESAAAVAEVGADMSHGTPQPIDPQLLARADRVIVLGRDAHVDPIPGMRARGIEVWDTDEPSNRGIEGQPRMRLVRDDITARCQRLLTELAR